MEKHLRKIKATALFSGFSDHDLAAMLRCLAPAFFEYSKSQLVSHNTAQSNLFLVIKGKLWIQMEDLRGNITILDDLAVGDIFLARSVASDCNIMLRAVDEAAVMQIDCLRLFTICPNECSFHRAVILKLFDAISDKMHALNQKIYVLQNSTIREKLMAYFSIQMRKAGSSRFTIPFNRGELADYIGANRSAMSRELHRMLDENLIEMHGSEFNVL